jgi:hypothetical protein
VQRAVARVHDKGKPPVKVGRKAMGPVPEDRQVSEWMWSSLNGSSAAAVDLMHRWSQKLRGFTANELAAPHQLSWAGHSRSVFLVMGPE